MSYLFRVFCGFTFGLNVAWGIYAYSTGHVLSASFSFGAAAFMLYLQMEETK